MAISFDVKDIKPLLSGLKLGDSPDATPKPLDTVTPPPMTPQAPLTPPPPQATPAVAGFSEWSADPQNQQKVAHGITPPGQPIIPQDVRQQATQMASLTPPPAPNFASLSGPPNLPPAVSPNVSPAPNPLQTKLNADQSELTRLQTTGSGASQIKNKPGRIAAEIADVAGSILAPRAAAAIPGTTLHNYMLQDRAQGRVTNDQTDIKDALANEDTQSQTAQRNAMANKANAQADAVGDPNTQHAKQIADAAKLGMTPQWDANGNLTGYAPDVNSPKYQMGQAQLENVKAQKELRDAQTALARAKNDPNSPTFKQAQQRVNVAQQNASISAGKLRQSELTYAARYLGTGANGEALPGTMITDEGTPVGSAFSGNVRPTGTERNKGDMAASADEQLGDIKSIMQKHPTLFGPGYGQTSQFRQWLGSQDPDAQRFMAARTIAADHLAGTFGGRSEAALDALDKAIGQFKDNPQAALAGVDQLTKANSRFEAAGSVKTTGSNAAKGKGTTPPPTGGNSESIPASAAALLEEGKQHTFNNGQVWTKQNGKPVRVK